MTEEQIQKIIQEKLDASGYTEADLLPGEMEELRDEVIAELNGDIIFDGVLSPIGSIERNKKMFENEFRKNNPDFSDADDA